MLMDLVPVNMSFKDAFGIEELHINKSINNSPDQLKLSLLAHTLSDMKRIDNISAIDLLEGRIEPYPYQLSVALNVLKDKSSIALLADEVGLGKTIEVGIILKEHFIRGNINTVLIITPKALVNQWQDEMREKFDEEFLTPEDDEFSISGNRIILSYDKLARNVESFLCRKWDLVVVDEAHMLINSQSKRRKAIAMLDRRYILLCTATPLCNKLTDIYSLVDILYPGILGTEREFKKKYFNDNTGRVCKSDMLYDLRKIVSKVMIRTLRNESGVPFPQRFVYSLRVNGEKQEYELFETVINYLKKLYSSSLSNSKNRFVIMKEVIAVQQSLSSSPRALIKSMENRINRDLEDTDVIKVIIDKAMQINNYSKIEALMETLTKLHNEQAVIFTLRLETAYMLADMLNENFMPTRVYEGRLSGHERYNLVNAFREGKVKYLVATDAAAEGLNLQTASVVINYDLHWNPMKLEQRIGRVHRRGQKKDVSVFNIVIKNTIDDYVLKILFEKIDLFKMTIGGIEAVLADNNEDKSIEETIVDILLRNNSKRDVEAELAKFGNDLGYRKEQNALYEEFSQLILD